MKEDAFFIWLLEKYNNEKGVSGSRKSNCKLIEKYEGIDLDEEFEKDSCLSILNRLTYTKKDEIDKCQPRHKIPINGNIYNGTQTYKQAANLYIQFRKGLTKNNTDNPKVKNPQKQTIYQIEIDKFGIVNIAFRKILFPLAEFVGKALNETDNKNWWKRFVIDKLPKTTIDNLPHEGSYDKLIKKLDIQTCLNIIEYNWFDIFKNIFKHKEDNPCDNYRTWARELKDIRNNYDAHYTIQTLESFNDNKLKRALDTMALFMEPIDNKISEEIRSIKDDL